MRASIDCAVTRRSLGLQQASLSFVLILLFCIREFPSEEVAFYCNALKLETIAYPVLGSLVSCVI